MIILGAMAAVPAMTMDAYLPSLPDVARDLGASASLTQATISGVLIGGAVGQLLLGPLSDRFGRRRPFMAGMTLHVTMSVVCALSPSIAVLLGARVLQGIGNASAAVSSMSVLRDRHTGPLASAAMSRIQMMIALAPILAPAVGGFIAHHVGWRAVFVFLGIVGLLVMGLVWRLLPESHPPERRTTGGLRTTLANYVPVLGDAGFRRLAIVPAMALAVLMSYVASSSFIFQEHYGMSAAQFSAIFALNGIGIILGAHLNTIVVHRASLRRVLIAVLAVELAIVLVFLVVALRGLGGPWGVVACMWALLLVNSMVLPNAVTLALGRHGRRAGTAASVMGAFQAACAGLISPVVGLLGGTPVQLVGVILVLVAVALTMALLGRRDDAVVHD